MADDFFASAPPEQAVPPYSEGHDGAMLDEWGNPIYAEDAQWLAYKGEQLSENEAMGEAESDLGMERMEGMMEGMVVSAEAPVASDAIGARIFAGLNPAQQQAVETTEGPVLVLAAAGSGKTRVLTHRLAWVITTGRAQPWQTLTVTFTNKAAREMRIRIESLIGEQLAAQLFMGTFHSVSARILRQHAELIDFKPDFQIIDRDDSLRLLKEIMEARGIDVKKIRPQVAAAMIDGWKNESLFPEDVTEPARAMLHGNDPLAASFVEVYAQYQQKLRALNAMDFGDLLLFVIRILRNHPDVRAAWQDRIRYLMVDEYQDTNSSQYEWMRLLVGPHQNVCCVGDDDQSIYGWRGARVANVFDFATTFPGSKEIRLEINYRSSGNILRAADQLISKNTSRMGKRIVAADTSELGAPISVVRCANDRTESDTIVQSASKLREQSSLSQVAVLVRAAHLTRGIEESLLRAGLPYRVYGGLRFYEREEIRDVVAYLRLVRSDADDLAMLRIANRPTRGVGDKTMARLNMHAVREGMPLFRAIPSFVKAEGKKHAGLVEFYQSVDGWHRQHIGMPPADVMWSVLEDTGYLAMWEAQQNLRPEAKGKLENLAELRRALTEFSGLSEFLDHVALVMENESQSADREAISIMTMHAAKGLEFDYVFLPGWEEGIFPNQRSIEESDDGIEEERRLAYVALTRARRELCITFATRRQVFGTEKTGLPSRFLTDLDSSNVRQLESLGMGYGAMVRERRTSLSSDPPPPVSNYAPADSSSRLAPGTQVRLSSAGQSSYKSARGVLVSYEGQFALVEFERLGRRRVLASQLQREE